MVFQYLDGAVWFVAAAGEDLRGGMAAWVKENQRRKRKGLTILGRLRERVPGEALANAKATAEARPC
jgi:hypothetical protein